MNIVPNFSQRHVSEDNKVAKSDQPDRLSELPNSLIFVILSFLRMRDVVRTTFLSKRWRNLWTTVSYLDFWYHEYNLNEYRSFINGALSQWKGSKILKFCIPFCVFYPRAADVDSWLLFAIENQSEELSILLGRYRDGQGANSDYCPPQLLYSCSWITKLSLSYCKLKIHEHVHWDQLKSLTIEGLGSLSEDAMNQILSGAPLLEELNLVIRDIIENFYIQSTRLKILRFGTDDYCFGSVTVRSLLKIWAPNLTTLEFSGRIRGNFLLYAPCLTNAVLYLIDFGYHHHYPYKMFHRVFLSISHAKNVTLSLWCIKYLLHMKNNGMVVRFSNAKFLHLSTGEETGNMLHVLEMFPNLRTLIAKLDFPESGYTFESETTPSLLHLKTVDITWSLHYPSIFPMIEILLKKGHMLEEMVLRLSHHEANPEAFVSGLEKVLSMPRSSPRAKVMIRRK